MLVMSFCSFHFLSRKQSQSILAREGEASPMGLEGRKVLVLESKLGKSSVLFATETRMVEKRNLDSQSVFLHT
jgi:hypothetical protein